MSKVDVWMPLFVADYLADTSRLTLTEHGAYLRLLMDYWRNGAPPDDDATLARILGIDRRAWCKLRAQIAPFFVIQNGRWTHKRVEQELAGARERSGKAAEKAKTAATRRWQLERERRGGPEADAPSIAPSIPGPMPGALPQAMPEQCPSPVTCSVPTEQAQSAPEDPNKEAWRRGVALLTRAGRMAEPKARSLFGRILSDNTGTEARDLLPYIVKAEGLGTQDPQGYLIACAKAVAQRRAQGGASAPNVAAWDADVWRVALQRFKADPAAWSDAMGPKPGEPGCLAPADLLAELGFAGRVIPLRREGAA
jgi:uncharacterized protein YdaU (DUF1376 family)